VASGVSARRLTAGDWETVRQGHLTAQFWERARRKRQACLQTCLGVFCAVRSKQVWTCHPSVVAYLICKRTGRRNLGGSCGVFVRGGKEGSVLSTCVAGPKTDPPYGGCGPQDVITFLFSYLTAGSKYPYLGLETDGLNLARVILVWW